MAKKHKEHHEEHMDESWLVPYADILTLLLALFIVLFASSQVDQKKFTSMKQAFNVIFDGNTGIMEGGFDAPNVLPSTPSNASVNSQDNINKDGMQDRALRNIKKQFDEYIKQHQLTGQLDTKIVSSYLVITIREKVLFDSGSDVVKPEFLPVIQAIANILRTYGDLEVMIGGHTDNVPIHNLKFETNWDLSSARALSFMKILIKDGNLDPERFSAIGFSEYHPVADNDTAEGRAKNRRVEVTVKGTNSDAAKLQ